VVQYRAQVLSAGECDFEIIAVRACSNFGNSTHAILVGPTSEQKRFHPDGELASLRGASAARTVMVVSGRASYPIHEIAAQSSQAADLMSSRLGRTGGDQLPSQTEGVQAGLQADEFQIGEWPQVAEVK
jgi:hypothetical protein